MTHRALHVVICNERLLPRFGVDRMLLLLGEGLRKVGHRITFVCQRCDRAAVTAVTPSIVEVAPPHQDILGADQDVTTWLDEHWTTLAHSAPPDVLVSGGWPFFGSARVSAERGVPSVFIDAGAVPHDGLPDGSVLAQRAVRRLRADALSRFTMVLPISRFIHDTQTVPDRGTRQGVETVLLGADHLAAPTFAAPSGAQSDREAVQQVTSLTAAGHPLIMLLGRFEQGYKNSAAAYEILARVLDREPRARLLVLAERDQLPTPDTLQHAVVPLGYVSDATLAYVMQRCALGLSMSLWEGFNLPLAEMQWYERPVLAFNAGAHPEVICDPWMLSDSVEEMAAKAISVVTDGLPQHFTDLRPFERFRERFGWRDVIARYTRAIERVARTPPRPQVEVVGARRPLLIDCTNASIDPANPGVIRVVRRLAHELQDSSEFLVLFTRWDAALNAYRPLAAHERARLASFDGPVDGVGEIFRTAELADRTIDGLLGAHQASHDTVLLIPEVVLDGRLPERIVWARAHGFPIAAILYDLIPITHAPFCSPDVVSRFPEYLEGLAAVDNLFAISGESLRQFSRYANRHALPHPSCAEVIWLPAQFGVHSRQTIPQSGPDDEPLTVLCVGSIEPRKNHRALIEAFRALLERRRDLRVQLVLAGHRFGGAEELSSWVEAVCREEPRITWTGLVSDDVLAGLFTKAAFTVYPSLVEGFGLPVVESLWMGRPVLCHSEGVMAELASAGGCLTADMRDPVAIEHALDTLAGDSGLRRRLTEEAVARSLLDWSGYASAIAARLRQLPDRPTPRAAEPRRSANVPLQMLMTRMREEAQGLRLLPEPFVQATNISVF